MAKYKTRDVDLAVEHVPERLLNSMVYLNQLLKAIPHTLTKVLDPAVPVAQGEGAALDRLSILVRNDKNNTIELSAFGVIAGFVNSGSYRLAMYWETDDASGPIACFKIVHVSLVEEADDVLGGDAGD